MKKNIRICMMLFLALLTSVNVFATDGLDFSFTGSQGYEGQGSNSNIAKTYNTESLIGISNTIDNHWSYIFSTGYISSRSLLSNDAGAKDWFNTSAIPIALDMNWADNNSSRFSTMFALRFGYDIVISSTYNEEKSGKQSIVTHEAGYYDDGFNLMPQFGFVGNAGRLRSQITLGYNFHLNMNSDHYMINQLKVNFTLFFGTE